MDSETAPDSADSLDASVSDSVVVADESSAVESSEEVDSVVSASVVDWVVLVSVVVDSVLVVDAVVSCMPEAMLDTTTPVAPTLIATTIAVASRVRSHALRMPFIPISFR
ncbi:hypothetical protein [Microbacterium telephonicum]